MVTDPKDAEILELRKALATLERIVSHYGTKYTEKGLPHPQQQALDQARKLLETEHNGVIEK